MTKIHFNLVSIRLPRFQRWATYMTLGVAAVSGLAWLALHDGLRSGWFTAEHRLLVTHGVASALSLTVIGGLLPLHVRLAWRTGRNLWSGFAILAGMLMLGVSGLLLYYGDEEWRDPVRWLHIGTGVLGTAALPVHVWMGRRRTAALVAPGPQPAQLPKSVRRAG